MSTVFHYDETPLPVGNAMGMNGNRGSYELGFYDGSLHAEQFADGPEEGVLFESPDGARAWLEAVTAVLTPYIETGDRGRRIPNAAGWSDEDEVDPEVDDPANLEAEAGR